MERKADILKRLVCLLLAVSMTAGLPGWPTQAAEPDTVPVIAEEDSSAAEESSLEWEEPELTEEPDTEEPVSTEEAPAEEASEPEQEDAPNVDAPAQEEGLEAALEEEPQPVSKPSLVQGLLGGLKLGTQAVPQNFTAGQGTGNQSAYTFGPSPSYNGTPIPLSDCLFTFHRNDNGTYVISAASSADWSRVYLNLNQDGLPGKTTPQKITITASGDTTYGEFILTGENGKKLWFSRWNVFNWFSNSNYVEYSYMRLYRPAAEGDKDTPTEIPGYVRLTSLTEIQDGGQYIIAAAHCYTDKGGALQVSGYDKYLFAVRPTVSTVNNDHVVRIDNVLKPCPSGEKEDSVDVTLATSGGNVQTYRLLDEKATTGTYLRTQFETNKERSNYVTDSVTPSAISDLYAKLYDGKAYNGENILLGDCLYTFTNRGNDKGWDVSAVTDGGATVHLNFNKNSDGCVQKTSLEENVKLTVTASDDTSGVGDFIFTCTTNNNGNLDEQKLWFCKWNIFKFFNDSRAEDYSYFRLYEPTTQANSSVELPGYRRVTSIQSGHQYLIVKYQSHSDSSGYGQYFVLRPSSVLRANSSGVARNTHVARATAKLAHSMTKITFTAGNSGTTGLAEEKDGSNHVIAPQSVIPFRFGNHTFRIRVFSAVATPVTPYNTVFIAQTVTGGSKGSSTYGDKIHTKNSHDYKTPVSRLTISSTASYSFGVFAPENLGQADNTAEKAAFDASTEFTFDDKKVYSLADYEIGWYSTNPDVLEITGWVSGGAKGTDTILRHSQSVTVTARGHGVAEIGVFVKEKGADETAANYFSYQMPVIVVESNATDSFRTLDAHIWTVENTTPYYSLNCSTEMNEIQLYDAMYVRTDGNEHWSMDFFADPADGHALTNLSNSQGNDAGHYFAIENDRPASQTTFYTQSGAAAQNQTGLFGPEKVQAMIQAAMDIGCEGAAGYTRGENWGNGTLTTYMVFVSKPLPRYAKELHGLLHKVTETELANWKYLCFKPEEDSSTPGGSSGGNSSEIPAVCIGKMYQLATEEQAPPSGVAYTTTRETRLDNEQVAHTCLLWYVQDRDYWVDEHSHVFCHVEDEWVLNWKGDAYLYVSFEKDRTKEREVNVGDTVCFKVFMKTSSTEPGQLINYSNVTFTDTLDGAYFMNGNPAPSIAPPDGKLRAQDEDWSNSVPNSSFPGVTTDWSGKLDGTSGATLRPSHANKSIEQASKPNVLNLSQDLNLRTNTGDEANDHMVGRCYEFYIGYEVKKTDFGRDIVNTLELKYDYGSKYSTGAMNNNDIAVAPNIKVVDYNLDINHIAAASLNVGSSLDINFYAYPIDTNKDDENYTPETDISKYFMMFMDADGNLLKNGEVSRFMAQKNSSNQFVQTSVTVGSQSVDAYCYTYEGIYAYQMPDNINAFFCRYNDSYYDSNADGYQDPENYTVYGMRTYSVKTYAERMLKKTDSGDAKLRSMLVDMLNYGATAQEYANSEGWGNVSNVEANEALRNDTQAQTMLTNGGKDITPATLNNLITNVQKSQLSSFEHSLTQTGDPKVSDFTVALVLEEGMGMTLRVTFDLAEGFKPTDFSMKLRSKKEKAMPYSYQHKRPGDSLDVGEQFTGTPSQQADWWEVNISQYAFEDIGSGRYAVEIKGVPPFFWGENYQLVIERKDQETVLETDTLEYSVMSYCYSMMKETSETETPEGWTEFLNDLLKAMYNYRTSADDWYRTAQ